MLFLGEAERTDTKYVVMMQTGPNEVKVADLGQVPLLRSVAFSLFPSFARSPSRPFSRSFPRSPNLPPPARICLSHLLTWQPYLLSNRFPIALPSPRLQWYRFAPPPRIKTREEREEAANAMDLEPGEVSATRLARAAK